MSGKNGGSRPLKPGQNVHQGQVLGQGGMEAKEMELREDLNKDLMMLSPLQQSLSYAGAIVTKLTVTGEDSTFQDSPERERQLSEAMDVHKDFVEMEIRLLKTIRRKMKKCAPFKDMKDLKLGDEQQVVEV